MVLLHLTKILQQKYPIVYKVMASDTDVDDAGVFGDSEEQVIEIANQVIHCLQEAAFKDGKILTENQKIMKSVPKECLQPSIIQAVENKDPIICFVFVCGSLACWSRLDYGLLFLAWMLLFAN